MGEYLDRETAVKAFNNFDAVVVTRCKDCKHSTLPSELTQRYGKPGTIQHLTRKSGRIKILS